MQTELILGIIGTTTGVIGTILGLVIFTLTTLQERPRLKISDTMVSLEKKARAH